MRVSTEYPLAAQFATERRARRRARYSVRWHVAWLLADLALINVAFVSSYVMRYRLGVGGDVLPQNDTPLASYRWIELTFSLIMLLLLSVDGVYRPRRSSGLLDQLGAIFRSGVTAVALIAALVFMLRPYAFSRGIFVYVGIGSIALLSLARCVAFAARRWRYRSGEGITNVLVLGGTRISKMAMQRLVSEPGLGYHVVGFLDDGDGERPAADFGRFKWLGRLADLDRVIREHGVEEVLVALPATAHRQILRAMQQCAKAGADFAMVPDLLELRLSQLDVDTVGGIPVISLKQNAIQGFNGVFKRTIDLVLASTLLILGSPIILIAAIATKLDSPGPVFFGQVRVGKDGRLFKAWKIRSMKVNAEEELESLRQREEAEAADKIMIKLRDDPRRTRVGKLLRKTSLDELPQCWNVLRGEMSFVGPRPPVPREVLRYEDWHKARLQVVPGMTGLWQVSGRSFLDFEEMVMLDLYYIENWSPGLELKILLQTIPAVLTGRGAF